MIESRRVAIAYHGQSSGSGPLSLGQDNMMRCTIENEPADINKQGSWPVPDGTSLDQVISALRTLAERHEALRTVYPYPDGGGRPVEQVVLGEGEFGIDVVETDRDPLIEVDEIGRRNRAIRFDVAREFPLRLTLVTVDGVPKGLSAVICHAAADGAATAFLVTEWLELVSGRTLPPHTGPTPRQVALDERSPAGLRRTKSSLQHWERILSTGPHAIFADARLGPSDGTHTSLVIHSVRAAEALEAVSARLSASTSTIIMAAYAAMAALQAGRDDVVIAALSANRHRRSLVEYVGTVAQDALIALSTDTPDFDELIGRAGAAGMTAYWHSSFDSAEIWRLIDEIGARRGARFARHLVLNDLSTTVPDALLRDIPAPPEDPHVIPLPVEPIPTRLMLNVWRLRGCVSITLHADRQLFTEQEAEDFARGLLRLIEEAAERTVPIAEISALTGIEPGPRPGEWRLLDSAWVDLAAVRELLATALDKRPVDLEESDGRLIAHIGDDDRPLTPREVHEALVDVLFHRRRGGAPGLAAGDEKVLVGSSGSGWETTIAPHHYVIHRGAPHGPVVAEGAGRDEVQS
ncbi:condensation domain-containing protein [Actinospica robiniae]|uniref:condensation domain-containing protein n=1 Tax=Actinospica robiniae TaxID=304901 RepID=UPI00040DB756|nr:condensation domain-containing protein [Actinospica robiniae]